ncbi:hypothetical protein HQ520_04285 [bacterium]|nr:hypothetical protein [bacterium]
MSPQKKNADRRHARTIRLLTALILLTSGLTVSFGQETVLRYRHTDTDTTPARAGADFLILPASFHRLGSWQIMGDPGALDGQILYGRLDLKKEAARPAEALVQMPQSGTWRVWVRCREFTQTRPGVRFFDVRIGAGYQGQFADEGLHDGYGWEEGGTVQIPAGDVPITIIDTSAEYARFDALLLTRDLEKRPTDRFDDVLKNAQIAEPRYVENAARPPDWAASDAKPVREETIGNERARVRFFETPSNGRSIIQKQNLISHEGRWYAAGERTDLFAWVVMGAESTSVAGDYDFACDRWDCVIVTENGLTTVGTASIFESGVGGWLVPTKMRRISESTIELRASCALGSIVATWSLAGNAQEPLVECRFTAAGKGSYCLGMFAGPETPLDDVDYVLCAKPYLGKYVPPLPSLVRENASPNACSLMTLPLEAEAGAQATFGIAPDPSSVPYHWATEMESRYGLGIRGPRGGIQTWLFAPLPGRPEGRLEKGQTFAFSYRPLFMIGGWNDMFRHVTDDILSIRDVKKNYHSSLTDAIFNVQNLIMAEQKYSGWSDRAMAHAYVEAADRDGNNFNHSSPLTLIQNYLFTEDRDWYVKRTIPTLAYWLSRAGWMSLPYPGKKNLLPSALVAGGRGYPSSVFAGFYLMSQGRTPAYRAYGFPEKPAHWNMAAFAEMLPDGASMRFLEDLYRYRLTQDPAFLEQARKGADAYIEAYVQPASRRPVAGITFEIMATAPWTPALLSMYEVTGEKKYLEAAEAAARKLLAQGVWMQPRVPESDVFLNADVLKKEGFFHDPQYVGACVHGWNGDTRMILGYRFTGDVHGWDAPLERTSAFDRIQDETVPAWLLSRVGLNVEGGDQLSHGMEFRSPNITMNCYAPDLLRLAEYTGDHFYETVARHETLGRAANYPGYYIDHMSTIYMKPDYPYEGPDITAIEYTHIPPYLAKIQDFLITQAWAWSDRRIEFPWVRQYAYCYFDNKVYGFEPGKFFDQDGMWIWLKRGLIQVDNVQIDWLGARKEGLFAAALMNEDDHPIQANVSLGEAVTGNAPFSGSATTYDAGGNRGTAPVQNNRLTLTVPAKGLIAFAIASKAVHSPRFAGSDLVDVTGTGTGETAALPQGKDDFGTGYVLQIDPESWFAYTFLPHKPDEIRSAVLHYRIGEGEWKTQPVEQYPFEKIVEVPDPEASFTFRWEMKDKQGTTRSSTEKRLLPLAVDPRR